MAIPKTMDNDVAGYRVLHRLLVRDHPRQGGRSTASEPRSAVHERIGVFRIFGRDAGFSALYTAYVTSARCVIPEVPYDLDAARGGSWPRTIAATRSRYAIVITAEGAIWEGAEHPDVGERRRVRPSAQGQRRRGAGQRTDAPGPASRRWRPSSPTTCGPASPTALDQMVAIDVRERRDGPDRRRRSSGGWSAIRDGKYAHVDLQPTGVAARRVDVDECRAFRRLRRRAVPAALRASRLGDPLLLTSRPGPAED